MTWQKRITRSEKVGLELTQTERNLLLTGIVFLHKDVEAAIRSTPPGDEVMLTVSDLAFLVGHVAGEANHAKSERVEEIPSGLFEKTEAILDLYAGEDEHTRSQFRWRNHSGMWRRNTRRPGTEPVHAE
jgi:hypothetical protein